MTVRIKVRRAVVSYGYESGEDGVLDEAVVVLHGRGDNGGKYVRRLEVLVLAGRSYAKIVVVAVAMANANPDFQWYFKRTWIRCRRIQKKRMAK